MKGQAGIIKNIDHELKSLEGGPFLSFKRKDVAKTRQGSR